MANVEIIFAEKSYEPGGSEYIPSFGDWINDGEFYRCDRLRSVFEFELSGNSPEIIAELAYAICNSYPEELHVSFEYAPIVGAYRAGRNRSLSVGDIVKIDGVAYIVANFGFKQVPDSALNGLDVVSS